MITEKIFGKLRGIDIPEVTISNANGMEVSIISYGATIRSVIVPTADGKRADIALGYAAPQDYAENSGHFGGTIGRYANRIGGAAFSIDGVEYHVTANENKNCLHGGKFGFDAKIWNYTPDREANAVTFTCKAADGEEGFPGNVEAFFTVTVTEDNKMILNYRGKTDKATPFGMTNHWYMNLNGHESGTHFENELQIHSDGYTVNNAELIPTGEIRALDPVLDFRQMKAIGQDIEALKDSPSKGYDHNYVIGEAGVMKNIAAAYGPKAGIFMKLRSDAPAVQLYTGNYITERAGKDNTVYHAYNGFCLETQLYPDSPNKPQFPNCILRPGEEYTHTAEFAFSTKTA